MTDYRAPIADMQFVVEALADLDQVARLDDFEEISADLVATVFEEAGRLATAGDSSWCGLPHRYSHHS